MLSLLAAAKAFVRHVNLAGTLAIRGTLQSPAHVPFLLLKLDPHLIHGSLDPYESAPNGILISSAVFTCDQHTQTRRPRHVRYP